jgi:nitrite reductase/ring-hydroxylating ferredoxin subunit
LVGDPDAKPSTPKVARTDRRSVDTTELAQLAPGELRAVSGGICVARTSRGLYAFPRYCPHEAADLAVNGFVRGDRIVCGWHNVAYDPDSGAPPCEGLRGLRRIDIERL